MIHDIVDVDSFQELKVVKTRKKSFLTSFLTKGEPDNAVTVGVACVEKQKTICIQLDKAYKMGTIGVFEGEKITLAFEYATKKRLPVIAVVASGGVRVQEGTLALMQMVKISAAVKQHCKKRLLFIAIVTNPTLGGASASFVSLADIIVAENGVTYGFSGRRIIENTTHERLPVDFQTAEYAKQHGMIDIIVNKDELKCLIGKLFRLHTK